MAMLCVIITANVLYMGGWILELIARWMWKEKAEYFSPMVFALGITQAGTASLLPAMLFLLEWFVW